MRVYIPPEQYAQLTAEQRQMFDSGSVARLLIATGLPILSPQTIAFACYRINMLAQADVQVKIATGMPIKEIVIPDVVTPSLLIPFDGTTIEGQPFELLSNRQFASKLASKTGDPDMIAICADANAKMRMADLEGENAAG